MNNIQKFTFNVALLLLCLNVFDGRYILVLLKDHNSFGINDKFKGEYSTSRYCLEKCYFTCNVQHILTDNTYFYLSIGHEKANSIQQNPGYRR